MSWTIVLYGLVPLLVFVIVDVYAGMRWAVMSAALFAVFDIFLSKYTMGEWDPGSFVALGLILALGAYSVKTNNALYFKLQPTVLAVVMASILAYFQFFSVPLGTRYLPLYEQAIPPEYKAQLSMETIERMINTSATVAIFVFLIHGALCALAAYKLPSWAWLLVRGVGFWILLIGAAVGVGIFTSVAAAM